MVSQTLESVRSGRQSQPPFAIKKILFATDFSEASARAWSYMQTFAREHGAQVSVVHVVGPGVVALLPPAEQQRYIRQAQEKMAAFLRRAGQVDSPGSSCRTEIRCGEPSRVICELGEEIAADLIVVGSNGRKGIKRFVLGSVAEEIFRLAPLPVLVVGPNATKPLDQIAFRRILFATDLDVSSLAALPYAIRMARDWQAELLLLSVAGSESEVPKLEKQLRRILAEAPAEPKAKTEVRVGPAAATILHVAATDEADLIVLGVRSGGTWDRAATHAPGPVAYNVVAQARCPVLTIRPESESATRDPASS